MRRSLHDHAAPVIAPSMLKCDFGTLNHEIEKLTACGAQWLHWDVMDGHFVPNLSYGAPVIASVRERTEAFFEAHLMISDPAKYLEDFAQAGCDAVTVHVEAVTDLTALLRRIRSLHLAAGLCLNPGTPVEAILPHLGECDLVLVMSVEPGFGGQKFIPAVLDKVRVLKAKAPPKLRISIDGGIGRSTIRAAAEAGADVFVAGSAIFDETDYYAAIHELKSLASA